MDNYNETNKWVKNIIFNSIGVRKEALEKIEGKKDNLYRIIIDSIPNEGLTRNEISQKTGIKITTICARVKELLYAGILYEDGSVKVNPETKVKNMIVKVKRHEINELPKQENKLFSQMTKRELYDRIIELENKIKKLKGGNI